MSTAKSILHAEKLRLSAIRKAAPDSSDIFAQSHFARYYCVLVCGLIETSTRLIINSFTAANCRPEVAKFVERKMHRYSDVGAEDLLLLVGSFSLDWRERCEIFIDGEIRDTLTSLVGIRNAIAHGGTTGISLGTIDRYYGQVERFIDFLLELFS